MSTFASPKLETVSLSHLPPELAVHVALYENLKNASFLRKQLLDGNSEFEYAFVDASKILSPDHIYAAVFRAVNDMTNKRMKSRNMHSEIVFSLSPNNHIAESFRKFGITDTTDRLLVVKLAPPGDADRIAAHLGSAVDGAPVEFSAEQLARLADVAEVRKTYKLGRPEGKQGQVGKQQGRQGQGKGVKRKVDGEAGGVGEEEAVAPALAPAPAVVGELEVEREREKERRELEAMVLTAIALRGAT